MAKRKNGVVFTARTTTLEQAIIEGANAAVLNADGSLSFLIGWLETSRPRVAAALQAMRDAQHKADEERRVRIAAILNNGQ